MIILPYYTNFDKINDLFTYRIKQLVGHAEWHIALGQKPIGEYAEANPKPPASEIWQGWQPRILLNVKV